MLVKSILVFSTCYLSVGLYINILFLMQCITFKLVFLSSTGDGTQWLNRYMLCRVMKTILAAYFVLSLALLFTMFHICIIISVSLITVLFIIITIHFTLIIILFTLIITFIILSIILVTSVTIYRTTILFTISTSFFFNFINMSFRLYA